MFNFATVLWHCLSAFLKSASLNIPGRSAPKTNIILQEIKCTFNCMVITSYHCYYCYYFSNSRFSVCSIKILKLKKYFWRNGLFKILRLFNEAKKPSYGSISCDHFSNRKTYHENIPTLSSDHIPVTSKTSVNITVFEKLDQNLEWSESFASLEENRGWLIFSIILLDAMQSKGTFLKSAINQMCQMYISKSNLGKSGMGFSWETMQSILSPANWVSTEMRG